MDASNVKMEVAEEPHIVSREKWKAANPKNEENTQKFPLPYLVLTHTNTPVCKTEKECRRVVRHLQKKHMAEGAPDIHHNYLISLDGTVYEGRSPRMVGMTYADYDEELTKANNNSINIAFIDNGDESLNGETISSPVIKLAEKLIRDNIISADSDIILFDQRKGKKQILSLSETMEKYKILNNNKGDVNSSELSTYNKVTTRENRKRKKKVPNDIKDTVKLEDMQGPFILEPHHFGMLIDRKDRLGREWDERDRFF